MKKKHLEKDIYLQKKEENYWWSRINTIIQNNNGISRDNKPIRSYNKSII